MLESYRVLAEPITHEIDKISGSRFIADAAPAKSEEEARAFLEVVRSKYHDARHHCWAYRVGPRGEAWRSSDDGEPSGSAGVPILKQLEGHDVTDLVVVVTRYFGGTKLGVGGLVRAYGSAAKEALEEAKIQEVIVTERVVVTRYFGGTKLGVGGLVRAYGSAAKEALEVAKIKEVIVTERVSVTYSYELSSPVQGVLARAGLQAAESEYGEVVRLVLEIPVAKADEVVRDLEEATAARATIERAGA